MNDPMAFFKFLMPANLANSGYMILESKGFVADRKHPLKVDIPVNGQAADLLEFKRRNPATFNIPLHERGGRPDRHVRIEFREQSMLGPAIIGMSVNKRKL